MTLAHWVRPLVLATVLAAAPAAVEAGTPGDHGDDEAKHQAHADECERDPKGDQ